MIYRKYNVWPTADPEDRGWYLVRRTVEEAKNRYGIDLSVCIKTKNGLFIFSFSDGKLYRQLAFDLFSFADLRVCPETFLIEEIFPTLREFAEERDFLKRRIKVRDVGVDEYAEILESVASEFFATKERYEKKLEGAVKRATRNKTSFRILKIYDRALIISFSFNGDQEIRETLEQFGTVEKMTRDWHLEVDGLYIFEDVVKVLKIMEERPY